MIMITWIAYDNFLSSIISYPWKSVIIGIMLNPIAVGIAVIKQAFTGLWLLINEYLKNVPIARVK